MLKTSIAQAFSLRDLGPGGHAHEMFVRQFRFPHEFTDDEVLLTFDLDEYEGDPEFEAAKRVFLRPRDGVAPDLLTFFREHNARAQVFLFLKTIVLNRFAHPVPWTGFRVLASRASGRLAFQVQLYAQPIDSRTPVFSTDVAPNVARAQEAVSGERDLGVLFGVSVEPTGAV